MASDPTLLEGTENTAADEPQPAPREGFVPSAALVIARIAVTALCVFVAFEPAVYARWQLLDDAAVVDGSLTDLNSSRSRSWMSGGRNFYFTGLYFEAQRVCFGREVRGFYVVQGVWILGTFGLIYWWTRRVSNSALVGLSVTSLFAVSSTVPEVTHTLYKLEVRLVPFWLGACVLAWRFLGSLAPSTDGSRVSPKWWTLGASGAVVYVGYFLGKETIALLVPSAGVVAAVGAVTARSGQRRYAAALAAFATIAAVAVYAAKLTNSQFGVVAVAEGTYSSLACRVSLEHAIYRFTGYLPLVPDVMLLGALVACGAVVLIGVSLGGRGFDPEIAATGLAAASCLAVIAFHIIIWQFVLVYYIYPAAAFGAVALGMGWPALSRSAAPQARWVIGIGTIACMLLIATYSVPLHDLRSMAGRKCPRADHELLASVASMPPLSRVGFNVPAGHEAMGNMPILLRELYGRTDLFIESAIQDGYFDRAPVANDYLAVRNAKQWSWEIGNRESGRSRDPGPNDARLEQELTSGRWEEVGVIMAAPRSFRRDLWPARQVDYTYEWHLYKRCNGPGH